MSRRRKTGDGSDAPTSSDAAASANSTSISHSTAEGADGQAQESRSPPASGTATPTDSEEAHGLSPPPPRKLILERRPKRPSFVGRMSGARKHSYTVRAPGTPFDELDLSEVDFLRHDLADSLPSRGLTRYRRLFFIVGTLLGAVVAWLVGQNAHMEQHLHSLRGMVDDQLSGLGIDFGSIDLSLRMPGEFSDLGDRLFTGTRDWFTTKDFKVGRDLADQGYREEFPVILLPGIISTGLESWTTTEDASGYFRKRLWGTSTMMRSIVFEKERWISQLSLDPETGLDPPGIKVRAAEGLDAASYFVTGYWIWSKIIENLAPLGYDTNNLWLASFDWRLSFHNLEVRDHFFTRMKLRIEQNKIVTGKKSVIVAHSMGSTVLLYFLKWVEADGQGYGNGGSSWVESHIESIVSIAGTWLGVPKTMAALLSGEMRDTVELPPAASFLLEKFFSRAERAKLFRTWAGSASMLIKGGEAVWGNDTWAPDDEEGAVHTHGHIYTFRQPHEGDGKISDNRTSMQPQENLTANAAFPWLLQHATSSFQRMVEANYSNGMEHVEEQLRKNNADPTKWSNPLEVQLPIAPSLKIFCLYGAGKSTERSYFYSKGVYEQAEVQVDGKGAVCKDDCNDDQTGMPPLEFPTGRMSWIDSSIHNESSTPIVRAGCKMGDGDGTVSLLSLGAMCAEGWHRPLYNPAGIKVVTHEVRHEPETLELRGGQSTGDHVDILGSKIVNELVLKVAAGRGHEITDNYVSKIRDFASKIKWDAPQS